MIQLTQTIVLNPKNQAWVYSKNQNGDFHLKLKKEKWELQLNGSISKDFDPEQFKNDSSFYLKATGKGLSLSSVGQTWKNSGVPLSFCGELGKTEVPMKIPEGLLRFYVGLIVHPFSDGNIFLSASLIYLSELSGKEASFLGEFLALMRQFEFSIPTVLPKFDFSEKANLNLKNVKLQRMESYDSGAYSGGGSYSIEETIWLFADQSCFYRYSRVASIPGLSGGVDQKESKGTWSFDRDRLDLNLWEIQNKSMAVRPINFEKVLIDDEVFWLSKI